MRVVHLSFFYLIYTLSINCFGQIITIKDPSDKLKKISNEVKSVFEIDEQRVVYKRVFYEEGLNSDIQFVVDYYSWNKLADKYLPKGQKGNHDYRNSPVLRNLILKKYSSQQIDNEKSFLLVWNLAIMSMKDSKLKLASDFMSRALKSLQEGTIETTNFIKADFYYDLARFSDSEKAKIFFYSQAIDNMPNRAYYYVKKSSVLIKKKRINEALENLKKADSIYPDENLFHLRNLVKSNPFFYEDYKTNKSGFDFKVILGASYLKKGNLIEAEEILMKSQEFYKDGSARSKYLGQLYIKAGLQQEGCECLKYAHKLQYQNKYFYENDFIKLLNVDCKTGNNKTTDFTFYTNKSFKPLDFWDQFEDEVFYKNSQLHFKKENKDSIIRITTFFKNGNIKNEFVYNINDKIHVKENKKFFNSGMIKTKWTYEDQTVKRYDAINEETKILIFDENGNPNSIVSDPIFNSIRNVNEKINDYPIQKHKRGYLRFLLGNSYLALEDFHSIYNSKKSLFQDTLKHKTIINFLMGKIYYDLELFDRSFYFTSNAFNVDRKNYLMISLLSEILFNLNEFEISKYYALEGLKISPNNFWLNRTLGKIYLREKDFLNAKKYLHKAKNKLSELLENYDEAYEILSQTITATVQGESSSTVGMMLLEDKYLIQSLFSEEKIIWESEEDLKNAKLSLENLLKTISEKESNNLTQENRVSKFEISPKVVNSSFLIKTVDNLRYKLLNSNQSLIHQGIYKTGTKINVEGLEKGLYILKIYDKEKTHIRRFVKE